MTTYLIHAGTGTIIDADDGVYVVTVTADTVVGDDDDEIVTLAMSNGKRLELTDLTWGNCVAYSPSAIRTEIRESLSWKFESPDDKPILEWALNASDDDLNEVASYILSGDHIWDTFATDLMDGLREGFAWSKERTPVKKDYTVDMVVRLYVEAESESEARSTAERLYFAWDPEGHNENRQYANMNVKEGHWFMFDYGQPKDDVWFPYESTNGGSDQSNGGN